MTGELELEGKVLVIKRIHARYRLRAGEEVDRDVVERVHGFHADKCPVARSIGGSIDITTNYELSSE